MRAGGSQEASRWVVEREGVWGPSWSVNEDLLVMACLMMSLSCWSVFSGMKDNPSEGK